ncbi:hypothetical protein CEUSTIGMA_g1039.t1 [Chlamydomonas eustigma]|uniref:Sphingomyelin synthase-like domain-containing protein n=1 Tax=Chlamydomonas eustigma TaxID=1157962 RepID=A0A250WRX4_9CHLO|nr:hypothetical protein CEUSTIGMA_g1039.t1 [Chlamydomonas eustigma]|eukprot:GAX73588.1 hypothetical protein CEUSTIGMA_g1039.t1 [Chlamydomonas eustigma]
MMSSYRSCCCFSCLKPVVLWRRVKQEVVIEWVFLKQRWPMILFGLIMQYVHGIFTQLAHRMHTQPLERPLHDIGFDLTPELGADKHWVSEVLFASMFISFLIWTFTPFFSQTRKKFYTVILWSRFLIMLTACQMLRIISFSVTQLPGSSFHCRAGQPSATRPWAQHWWEHLVVDVNRQLSKSCGDLIFSSHTIFTLSGILTYTEHGSSTAIKLLVWICGAILSVLIVASRKHYTVDVVIAWYAVPLTFYAFQRRWTSNRPSPYDFLTYLGENYEPVRFDADREKTLDKMDDCSCYGHATLDHKRGGSKGRVDLINVDVESGSCGSTHFILTTHVEGKIVSGPSHGKDRGVQSIEVLGAQCSGEFSNHGPLFSSSSAVSSTGNGQANRTSFRTQPAMLHSMITLNDSVSLTDSAMTRSTSVSSMSDPELSGQEEAAADEATMKVPQNT